MKIVKNPTVFPELSTRKKNLFNEAYTINAAPIWTHQELKHYIAHAQEVINQEKTINPVSDPETIVTDLLTALLLWCKKQGFDPEYVAWNSVIACKTKSAWINPNKT